MRMEGDMMQMRPLTEGLPVPADGVATLAPGGAHLMFMEITAPFVDGETVPVTLTFERAGVVEATLVVRAPGTVAHGAH
jgi:copper(I)-binding protein